MKVQALGLQTALVTSYDQTKTTLQGRVAQRSINDGNGLKNVLGPSPVIFGDVEDDTGAAPVAVMAETPNGRLFISKGIVAGILTISYYTFNTTTGVQQWQGDLKFSVTATGTYTLRGFAVDDTTSTAMTFHFGLTNTTTQQGGYYACFGVPTTDFLKVSIITYPVATAGSTTKTVYQIGDTSTQAAHTLTVIDGLNLDKTGLNTYILNGAAATPKIFVIPYSAPPTGTPTAGYVQWNSGIATGTLSALTGVILLLNNVQVFTPVNQPSPSNANNGFLCMGWLTGTNIYWAKVTDITSGVTTLPSLITAPMSGSSDYLLPSVTMGRYSGTIDKWVLLTSLGQLLVKQGIANDPNAKIISSNSYIKGEIGGSITPLDLSGITPACIVTMQGWAMMLSTGVGQRGFMGLDLTSDESSVNPTTGQILSSIISPVISGNFSQGVMMGIYYELAKRSLKATVQYRTSNFSTGPGAGFDATWTSVPKDGDLSTIVNASQVQFRFLFTMMGLEIMNPPQLNEAYFVFTDLTQNSDHWVGSVDNTSQNGANPFKVSFRLQTAYSSGTVPKLFIRGIDDSGNAVVFDTVTNIANMSYTTNNGTSYTPLGTIPNTALTTELQFQWTSPDGLRRRWSISES
jgi:hypothetical protein